MNFEEARKKYNSAFPQIKKMGVEALNLFSETHNLGVVISPLADSSKAHYYIAYKYLEKLCALNAIAMEDKWLQRLRDAEDMYRKTIKSVSVFDNAVPDKRGNKAAIIKDMLINGKSREEIKVVIMEMFPLTPIPNIGCQIAATICFLKRKGLYNDNSDKEV